MSREVATRDETTAAVEPISRELAEQFAHMATAVPSEDGSGYDSILRQLLSAQTWDALNDPWETTKAERLAGKRIRLDSITRRPSDYQGGLGIFLVVRGIDVGTGEQLVITTGSIAVVAQLVMLHLQKALPAIAEWVISERVTSNGFRPQHLRVLGITGSGPIVSQGED